MKPERDKLAEQNLIAAEKEKILPLAVFLSSNGIDYIYLWMIVGNKRYL